MYCRSFLTSFVEQLGWHPARCITFASIVLGAISQTNVQHHALSLGFHDMSGKAKSRLERIRRFFAYQIIDYQAFAYKLVLATFHTIPAMHLILDRTNWEQGKHDKNYLVLAARVGNITFPLFWELLDHSGASDTHARIRLMEMFRQTFGFKKVLSFTADREFIGKDWFAYLYDNHVPFLSASRIIG